MSSRLEFLRIGVLVALVAITGLSLAGQSRQRWFLSVEDRRTFKFDSDRQYQLSGPTSLRLTSEKAKPNEAGLVFTRKGAADYRGKRIRLSGYLRSEGLQQPSVMYAQVLSQSGRVSQSVYGWSEQAMDLSIDGWQQLSLILDVPVPSRSIRYGFQQVGPGTTWGDKFEIEIVPDDTPLVGYNEIHRKAVNPDFHDDEPTGLPLGWETRSLEGCTDFRVNHTPATELDETNELRGKVDMSWRCDDGNTAFFFQNLSSHRYLGKPASVVVRARFEGTPTIQVVLESATTKGLLSAEPATWQGDMERQICVDQYVPRTARTLRYGIGVSGHGSATFHSITFQSQQCDDR